MTRKIASVTPIWNQEMWIKPHFEMLSSLDHNLVVMHQNPLPSYRKEHGYSIKPDLSEYALRKYFPNVEIIQSNFSPTDDFGAELYNEGLRLLQDYDIVFRLDPDMFFTRQVWLKLLHYIQSTSFDAYRMDFAKDSINYYMTGDFEHGLKDAKEHDILALNPKMPLEYFENETSVMPLHWPHTTDGFIDFDGFMCHHARGWNKPKSTPNPQWLEFETTKEAFEKYSDNGKWYSCPEEIKKPIELWQKELQQLKSSSLQEEQKLLL